MATINDTICKPFHVLGRDVTGEQIAGAIDALASAPGSWLPSDIAAPILPDATWHDKQEALNRLMQRWRKLGLCEFQRGKWKLTPGAWTKLQSAARNVRIPA